MAYKTRAACWPWKRSTVPSVRRWGRGPECNARRVVGRDDEDVVGDEVAGPALSSVTVGGKQVGDMPRHWRQLPWDWPGSALALDRERAQPDPDDAAGRRLDLARGARVTGVQPRVVAALSTTHPFPEETCRSAFRGFWETTAGRACRSLPCTRA